jgi:hypothetical protein
MHTYVLEMAVCVIFAGKWVIFIYFSKKAYEIKHRSLPEGNV